MNLMNQINRTNMSMFPSTIKTKPSKETYTHVENDTASIFQNAVQKQCKQAFSVTAHYLNMIKHS